MAFFACRPHHCGMRSEPQNAHRGPNRRQVLAGLATIGALSPVNALAKASAPASGTMVFGADFGLVPDIDTNQSALLQKAINTAAVHGLPLFLAGGKYVASNIQLPGSVSITGVDGATEINAAKDEPIFVANSQPHIALEHLSFQGYGQGAGSGATDNRSGLLSFEGCENLRLSSLYLGTGHGNGLYLEGCSGRVSDLLLSGFDAAAIFAINSYDLILTRNHISGCGNGGILVWRDQSGRDGTIVTQNQINGIAARAGGSGQNGNGINIYLADDVIVADNVIKDCAFSAVRANSTRNVAIRGNTCTDVREVAIYSEFAFSGSVIANNIIDGAAAGISITNLDKGGELAVCSGNIVRNMSAVSASDPNGTPYGIYAEAETAITGNTVSQVPGVGIMAGNGQFLRNVLIANNVIFGADTGIGVSVADGAGTVKISDNIISGAALHGIVGLKWTDVASADLVADAGKFPNVSIEGNTVSR